MPNLCYWCGRLTHDDRDCELWIESEGTLKTEERQFGPRLRALTFVGSRKLGVKALRYYESRKKTASSSSNAAMDMENSGQATENLQGTVEQEGQSGKQGNGDKIGGIHDRGSNGSPDINPGINHINGVRTELLRDSANDKNSVLTSQTITDSNDEHLRASVSHNDKVDMNHEVTTNLNLTNDELAGFECLKESRSHSTAANAHATFTSPSTNQLSEARNHKKIARVPNSTPQRHVLPTWTQKTCEGNKPSAAHVEQIVGKK